MNLYFEVTLIEIASRKIIIVPLSISDKLPSRGMVMIQGTIDGFTFISPLEPEGRGGHWFEITDSIMENTDLDIGDIVSVDISPMDEWIEPEVPEDIINEIIKAGLIEQWDSITTKAKWEWIRWIRSTKNQPTRQKRIEVTCSKLKKGDKRPCCFDTTKCTITDVSKSGILSI